VKYWEDFKVGESTALGSHAMTEAEILAFARKYDPQPFHTDPEAAKATVYGGLIASGMQTIGIMFKLFMETGVLAVCSLGSPGLDEIRWKAPVRPGDVLRVVAEVLESRPSSSKPDRGIVRILFSALNQRGETVATFIGNQLCRRRPSG